MVYDKQRQNAIGSRIGVCVFIFQNKMAGAEAGGAGGTNFSFSVSPRWRLYMNINYKRSCTINSSKFTYILNYYRGISGCSPQNSPQYVPTNFSKYVPL